MKSQRVMPKWLAMAFALAVLLAFVLVLPSASAQDENPLTPTPFEPSLNPEATPTMEATPEPPPTLEIPQEDETQLLPQMQAAAPLSGTWSTQVDISNTVEESVKPKIATDKNGIEHVVWREVVYGGKQDILYTRYDGTSWSLPVNVSHSSSFNSDSPKLVTDSGGTAHIVWQEEDNDHADDYETLYSRCNETGCTSPVTLSDGQVCGHYVYDWKAIDPTIGIDANDRLMAVWMSYEPGRIYMMYSLWPASGLPPANRTGCHVNSGTYAYPMVAGDSNGNFHLAMMNYSYSIYYSKFVNGWSYVQNIGSGYDPVIHIDQNNKIHAAWWSNNAPPVYRTREGSASVWSTPENVFSSMLCSDISLITDRDNLPQLACAANGFVYETSRQADPEGWTEAAIIAGNEGMAGQPNLAKDMNGDLHLVWSDFRDENWEIYYANTIATRVPLIFLPGLTGSRIYAPHSFTWLQSNGHGGNYEHTYNTDEEIWINGGAVAFPGADDFFDILRLEEDGITQSTNAWYGVDLEARDIVGNVGPVDVYNNLLTDLQSVGYQLGIDLIIFPYDWRMDISHNAQLLDDKVLEALEIANGTEDQSQWKITQVDLVAHSMGASVAREYISYPAQAAHVHHLIAIGPVFLGAPKPLKSILFGDALVPGLDPGEAKDIVQNMPGAFQVSPGNAYWEFYDGTSGNLVVFQEDYDFDGDNRELGDLSYDQFKSMLFGLDRDPNLNWDVFGKDINQTVFNMAEAFHNRLDFSWDAGIPIPEVDLIVGTGLCSIGQYQSTWRIKVGPVRIDPIIRVNEVNGDGTVPLFSASLYDPDRGIDHRGGANVYYVAKKYASHAFLPSKESIRQLVLNLLKGDSTLPDGIIQEADVSKKCSGTTINVESPVELHVTDAAGNHTGWTTSSDIDGPMIEEGIRDSQYEEIEETKSVYLPDDGEYTIFLKATDSGSFNLILHLYKSDGTEKAIVYLRAPLTITTTGEMLFDTSLIELPLLNLDHDGDGVIDDVVEATSVLDTTESVDSKSPQIEIVSPKQGQVLAGSTLVEWQSNDDMSGVLNEWGYIDMGTPNELLVFNGAVMILPYGEHTLTVLAEDHLGNASQEQVSFTVYFFEWLSPISGSGTYSAKAGSTIPVKFRVHDLSGIFVHDESVELNLLDDSGNVIAGPFVFAHNPTQGVAILGNTQYHHNLKTKGLIAGTYTLQVIFNSPHMSGIIELPIILW